MHEPAITRYRQTNGYREGWDRIAEEWVPVAPPRFDASPEVDRRYRAAVARTKVGRRSSTPAPMPATETTAAAYQRGYADGYATGR